MFLLADAADAASASRGELLAAISGLALAIGVLWRMIQAKHKETENQLEKKQLEAEQQHQKTEKLLQDKWEECEKSHAKTQSEQVELVRQVGKLEGRIEAMSKLVLKKIHGEEDSN